MVIEKSHFPRSQNFEISKNHENFQNMIKNFGHRKIFSNRDRKKLASKKYFFDRKCLMKIHIFFYKSLQNLIWHK